MDHQEIKAYVIATIKNGSSSRIKAVLNRYQEYLRKTAPGQQTLSNRQESVIDQIATAKEIFGIKDEK